MPVRAHAMLLDRSVSIARIIAALCFRLMDKGHDFRVAGKRGFGPAGCGVCHRCKDKHHQRQKYGQRAQGNRAESECHCIGAASNIGKEVGQVANKSAIYEVIMLRWRRA